MLPDLLSLLLLGLVGQAHCLGMCGPILVALPGEGSVRTHLAYHGGRVATYALLGALTGAVGQVAGSLGPARWALQGVAALLLLGLGLARLGMVREPPWLRSFTPARLPGFGRAWASARGAGGWGSVLALGMLMGLLPCGLTLAALGRTLALGSAALGALGALLFGLGTLPALLLLGTAAGALLKRHRRAADLLSGMILVAMAGRVAASLLPP